MAEDDTYPDADELARAFAAVGVDPQVASHVHGDYASTLPDGCSPLLYDVSLSMPNSGDEVRLALPLSRQVTERGLFRIATFCGMPGTYEPRRRAEDFAQVPNFRQCHTILSRDPDDGRFLLPPGAVLTPAMGLQGARFD